MKITTRPICEADHNFILSTWLKCEKMDRLDFKCSPGLFYSEHEKEIKRVLNSCSGLVACPDDDNTQIFAYIIYSGRCTHFAYTKALYRKMGMFRRLFCESGEPSEYSRAVRTVLSLRKYFKEYNPYKFWRGNEG